MTDSPQFKTSSHNDVAGRLAFEILKPKDYQTFQRLCTALYREELGDPHAQEFGRSGQGQNGIDILGRRQSDDNLRVGVQCRLIKKPMSKARILSDAREALELKADLRELIFATTAPDDTHAQTAAMEVTQILRQEGSKLSVFVYGWGQLQQIIVKHDAAYRAFRINLPSLSTGTQPTAPDWNFGRETKAAQWAKKLVFTNARHLLVSGHPGIGKSTFTRAIGSHSFVRQAFGDARWWVGLEDAPDISSFRARLNTALGLRPNGAFESAVDRLKERPALLILDNLETPFGGSDRQAILSDLAQLADIVGLRLIASVRGEDYPAGPKWGRERLGPLDDDQSAKLFRSTAARSSSSRRLTDGDSCVVELLRELGGLPLAIVLVAGRLADGSTTERLWKDWKAIGVRLAETLGSERGAQYSLAASIELSLRSKHITQAGHRLYKLLGYCPSGISFEDIDQLLGGTEPSVKGRGELVFIGLAQGENDRLNVLPPVRNHAAQVRLPKGLDALGWAEYYLGRAQKEGAQVARVGGERAGERLAGDVANIDAAFRAIFPAIDAPERSGVPDGLIRAALDAVPGYARMARLTGLGSWEVLAEFAETLARADLMKEYAYTSVSTAEIQWLRSHHQEAKAAFERAKPIFAEHQDGFGVAVCEYGLGDLALEHSDYALAGMHYRLADRKFEISGSDIYRTRCTSRMGQIAFDKDDFDLAGHLYSEALDGFDHDGDLAGKANCFFRLGETERGTGSKRRGAGAAEVQFKPHFEKAIEHYEQAKALADKYSLPLIGTNAVKGLADVHLSLGQLAEARTGYDAARLGYEKQGALGNLGNAYRGLGDVEEAAGNIAGAKMFWTDALLLYRRMTEAEGVASIHERMARITTGKAQRVYTKLAIRQRARISSF